MKWHDSLYADSAFRNISPGSCGSLIAGKNSSLYPSEMKMQQGASERRVYKREAHTQATSNDAASSFPMGIDDPNHLSISKSDTHYKKSFGAWGESCVDAWMQRNGWVIHRQNLKMRNGEIDRVYKYELKRVDSDFCVAEIKTIYCANQKKFFSLFTEVGLSALIKRHQIRNIYKYAENLNSRNLQSFQSKSRKIYIRFFIVLKMYGNYEKETFFQSQKNYKVCLQTKDNLILSFVPEFQ